MSSNYSAGQFDDAFNPKRLGNWEIAKEKTSPIASRQTTTCSKTSIIANEKGHLLPKVCRNACSSPWGSLDKTKWLEESLNKISKSKSSLSTKQGIRNVIPKFQKKKPFPKDEKTSKPSSDFKLTNKDIVSQIKELKLPVIWVIGLPTKRILSSRRNFCRQLADTLEFTYINLDERIDNWRQRQKFPSNQKLSEAKEAQKLLKNRNIEHTVQKVTHRTSSKRVQQKNVHICVETVVPHSVSHNGRDINGNYRRISKESECMQNNGNKTADVSHDEAKTCTLSFELSEFFTRETIFELIQFAMFESLPTNGFVIEGFPYDRTEAASWEKMMYPSALALYFMEGKPVAKTEPEIKSTKITYTQDQPRYKKPTINPFSVKGNGQKKLIPIAPRYVRRFLPYSLPEAERVCEKYGHKLIRIVNAEDVVFGGMNFLSCLVEKALSQYANILSGKTKISYESDVEKNSYISSIESVLSESEERGFSNFLLPQSITPELPKKQKKDFSKNIGQVRIPKFSHFPKKIKKVQSNTSYKSVKPHTPPSSYEYCLPTPTLFTIRDHIGTSRSVQCSEDDFTEQQVSAVGDEHKYTPLSWTSENVIEGFNDDYLHANIDKENNLTVEDYYCKTDEIRLASEKSSNTSLCNSFEREQSCVESEKPCSRTGEANLESQDELSNLPHGISKEAEDSEYTYITDASDFENSYCTEDEEENEDMQNTEFAISNNSNDNSLGMPNNYCETHQNGDVSTETPATSEKLSELESHTSVQEDALKYQRRQIYHDRGDQSMNSEERSTDSDKTNGAGEDLNNQYFVFYSRPKPI